MRRFLIALGIIAALWVSGLFPVAASLALIALPFWLLFELGMWFQAWRTSPDRSRPAMTPDDFRITPAPPAE